MTTAKSQEGEKEEASIFWVFYYIYFLTTLLVFPLLLAVNRPEKWHFHWSERYFRSKFSCAPRQPMVARSAESLSVGFRLLWQIRGYAPVIRRDSFASSQSDFSHVSRGFTVWPPPHKFLRTLLWPGSRFTLQLANAFLGNWRCLGAESPYNICHESKWGGMHHVDTPSPYSSYFALNILWPLL